jgi:hypothetical protein
VCYYRASASTFSRWEPAATRKEVYRLAKAFVEHFMARDAEPLEVIVLDLDPSEDETHGR